MDQYPWDFDKDLRDLDRKLLHFDRNPGDMTEIFQILTKIFYFLTYIANNKQQIYEILTEIFKIATKNFETDQNIYEIV